MLIGYVCKYTPIEVLESMGADVVKIESTATNYNEAEAMMHPNMCSYAKSVLEDMLIKDYDGIVLATCCDSIRRLYDTIKDKYPDKFIYIIDIPRKINDHTYKMYQEHISEMADAFAQFSGNTYDDANLCDIVTRHIEATRSDKISSDMNKNMPHIGLIGARYSSSIRLLLKDYGIEPIFDLTCSGIKREFDIKRSDKPYLYEYAKALLNQIPCMRMVSASGRERYIEGFADRLDGIICHTVKFCDNYSYEYAMIHQDEDIPILKVETDMTSQCEGQIRTRIEAFIESINKKKGISMNNISTKKDLVLGIDSGSTSTNAVLMDKDKHIVAYDVLRTGAKSGDSADRILDNIIKKAHIDRDDIDMIVSTGYGRISIPFADKEVTEITCHGKGALYFNPHVRTILDIGGQDSKAIHISDEGEVTDFVMNDKCAAGTGRFLEMMAATLEISIDELGPLSLKWQEDITISSMCSVFAESEVISLIASNKEKSDIAHGIHKAIAGKSYALMTKVGLIGEYMMTGGVAKNPGVVRAVEDKIGEKLYICDEPEIVGAVGAALIGLES